MWGGIQILRGINAGRDPLAADIRLFIVDEIDWQKKLTSKVDDE